MSIFDIVMGLILLGIAYVGYKLFTMKNDITEQKKELEHMGGVMNDITNSSTYNSDGKPMLWNKPSTETNGQSYGPAPAKTEHAHLSKRGPPVQTIPNYPVPISESDLSELQKELDKDLDGIYSENSIGAIQGDVSCVNSVNGISNMPTGKPVVGRPTKEPFKEVPIAIKDRTDDGNYMNYENMMYGQDLQKNVKNDGIEPRSEDTTFYAQYDTSAILGC